MTAVLKKVLVEKDAMRKNADFYIDDIMVDEIVAIVDQVICHLYRFGLTAKQVELLKRVSV